METKDSFFNGRIQVWQPDSGYRFSIDAVILAYYANPVSGDIIADLGTGCGIIPMIMAYRQSDVSIYGIEIQQQFAQLAERNVVANHMENRIHIVNDDLRRIKLDRFPRPVDLVVTNPPFRKLNSGRINSCSQRAVARHEIKIDLSGILLTAKRVLRAAGRFITIYSAERLTDLLVEMRRAGIEPKVLRSIHSKISVPAKIVMVEGQKGGNSGTRIAAPVTLFDEKGGYTESAQRMFVP